MSIFFLRLSNKIHKRKGRVYISAKSNNGKVCIFNKNNLIGIVDIVESNNFLEVHKLIVLNHLLLPIKIHVNKTSSYLGCCSRLSKDINK